MMSGEPASSSTALPFILQQWSSCRSQKKLAAHHHLHYTFPRLIFSSLAFPTHGFSHLSLRLARTPLQHEVAPKSTGKGRNGAGDVVVGAHASHESAGVPPLLKKKRNNREKEYQFLGGGGGSQKIGIFEGWGNGVARGCSRAQSVWQLLCPTNQTKKQILPPKYKQRKEETACKKVGCLHVGSTRLPHPRGPSLPRDQKISTKSVFGGGIKRIYFLSKEENPDSSWKAEGARVHVSHNWMSLLVKGFYFL